MILARLEGAPLSKAYNLYVVEGGRLITQPKNFIWKPIDVLTQLTVQVEKFCAAAFGGNKG